MYQHVDSWALKVGRVRFRGEAPAIGRCAIQSQGLEGHTRAVLGWGCVDKYLRYLGVGNSGSLNRLLGVVKLFSG